MTCRARRLAVLAALGAAAACATFTVDGDALGSLEFVPLPYPSVNAGDTLRDSLGAVARLQARVYRADGTIEDRPVTFLSFDTLVRVVDGRLIAGRLAPTTESATAQIIASVDGVQSLPRTVLVVNAPQAFTRRDTATRYQVRYSLPPAPTDTFPTLAVRVTRQTATGPIGVAGYVVRYRVEKGGQPVPATDTTGSFWVADDRGRPSLADTTDESGTASRRLLYRLRSGRPARDTVEVVADVRRGTGIPAGPPIRWTVTVGPRLP